MKRTCEDCLSKMQDRLVFKPSHKLNFKKSFQRNKLQILIMYEFCHFIIRKKKINVNNMPMPIASIIAQKCTFFLYVCDVNTATSRTSCVKTYLYEYIVKTSVVI